MSDHLDDLPKRTDEHVGEDETRRKFDNLVGDPYFIVRSETENDYGTDVTVEALDDRGHPTNFRSHVQLKGSRKEPNKDGSYSFQVARTNLNYLLNSPASFYCFLARGSNKVFYRMAEDEYCERERGGTGWRTQKSLTIRFEDELDTTAIQRIRNQVLRINQYLRNLNLSLRTQAISLESEIVYDPETKVVQEITAARTLLREGGLRLVADGEKDVVTHCLALVSESQRGGAEWVVAAYLAYSTGNIFDAGAFADRALATNDLDTNKEGLAKYIATTSAFARGRIDREQLESSLGELASAHPTSVSALYVRLDEARRQALTGDRDHLDEVKTLVEEIEARDAGFAPLKLQANIVLLEARYFVLNARYLDEVTKFKVTETLGVDALFVNARAQQAAELVTEMRSIFKAFEDLYQRAIKMEATHPALIGEVISGLELCLIQNRMTMAKTSPQQPGDAERLAALTKQSIRRLDVAIAAFMKAGLLDAAARTAMLKVDALWIGGDAEQAKELARDIAARAAVLGLSELASRATDVVAGASPLDTWTEVPPLWTNP